MKNFILLFVFSCLFKVSYGLPDTIVDNSEKRWHKVYYESGEIQAEGPIKKNQITDRWRVYYESGEILSEANYKRGAREGWAVFYYKGGEIQQFGRWKKNLAVGLFKNYLITFVIES